MPFASEEVEEILDTENVYSLEEIKERLNPVFRAYHVRKATLFGSYARRCAHKQSDLDILVDSGLRGLSFFSLLAEVRSALAKKVHMFDVYYLKRTPPTETIRNIDKEITHEGVILYEG